MRIKRTDQLADDLTGLRRRIEVLEIKEGRGTPDDGGGEEPPPPGSPTVTAISPSQGIPQGGTNVTITGTNFTNVTGVVFGSTPATSFQVVSPTQINATAPANLSGVPGGGGNPTPTGKFTITGDGRIEDPNGLPWVACGGNIGGVRPTGGSQTGSQVLPAKILGGVLEPNYGGGPANLPDVYNLQLYQFCYIDEDGHLSWPYMSGWMGDYADESTIRAQIEAAQAEGQVILWDIGGGDDGNPLPVLNGLHTQTAQDNFFNDMVDFVDTFGFQGIAWGIEQWDGHEVPGGISSTGVVAVSRRLKAHYGPQFVVGIVSIINDFEQLTSEIGRELQRTGELDFFRFEFYNLWGWYVTGPEVINIIQQTINNIGYGFSANQFVVGHAAGLGATQGNGEPITLEDCLTSWDEAVQVYPDLRGVITYGPFTLDGEVLDYAWSAAMAERLFTGDTPSSGPGGATPGNWWYEANPAVDHTQDAENYGFNMMRLILFDGWEGDGWSYEQMRDGLFASIDAHIAKGIVVTWSLEALRGTNPTLTTVQNHYATKLQDDVVARYKSHAAGHYVWLNTLSAPYDYNNDSTWATVNSWLYSRARSQGWTHMQIVDLPGEGNDMSAAATEQFILDFMQGKTNVILGAHLYSPSGTLSVTGPQIRSRNLPLIVTEFGYAEGGSSTATDWVFASAWSGSLRFGGLMWQVAGDPDNDFTFRTGAGSAYWEATKALTALGQAMFDRGQLQLNSYDDGSSGGSGLSMEVVQDFNTGTEPSDANMTVVGGNGSGGTSTGQFRVEGGVIVDPNGRTFTPWGGATVARPTGVAASHAVFGTDSGYSYGNGNATRARADGWNATAVTALIPSLETTPPFTLAQSLEGLGQMLDEWTAQGIVCIVGPNVTMTNPANYAAVNAEIRAVQEYVCTNYRDNPFVWLETMRDSFGTAGATGTGQWPNWNATNTQCFNDAVARGWTNMQVFVLPGQGDGIAAVANGSLFDTWLAGKGDRVCLGWYNFGSEGSVEDTLTAVRAISARNIPLICTSFGQNWNDAGPSDGGNPTTDAVGVDYTALYGQTWEDGASPKPIVYLTFDDGPTVSLTESLIAILGSHGVKGTFFVDGINVDAHPTIAAAITAAGHGIGNHTYDHVDLTTLSSTEIREQIDQANEAILTATGVTTRAMRPPYGYTNATVEQVIAAAGMEQVLWTHDTNDWDSGTVASITAVLNTLPTSPGSVSTVLMHDWVPETQTALNAWLAANKTVFEFRVYGLASGSGGLHTGGIAWQATGRRNTANDYSWRYCTANGGVFRSWYEIAEGLNEVGRLIRDRGAQGYEIIGGGPIVNTAAAEGTGLRAVIVNGEMRANVMDDQIVMYHTADLLSTDHWVEADLLIGATVTGQYTGLVCRVAGTSTWYAFTMAGDATRMKFQRVSNGAPNAAIYGTVPGGFAPNTTRRLRMQVRNGSITCSVDGTVVINTLDNTASSGGGTGTTGTTNGAHVFSTNFTVGGGAAPTMFSDDFEGRGRTIANGTLLDTQNSYARIDQSIPAAGFILGDESGNNYYSGVNEQGKPRFTTTAKNGTYAMRCGLVNAGAGQYGGAFYHYYADTPAPIVYFNWWYRFDAMTAQAAQNGSNPGLWLARPNWANFDAQTPHLRLSADLTLEQGDASGTYAMSQNTWYKMESVINGVLGTSTTTIRNAAGAVLDTIESWWTPVGNIGFIEFGALWCDMSAFTSIGYSYWDDVQMSSQPIGTGGAGGTTAADYGLDETPEYGLHGYNIPYVITDGVAYPAAWGDGYGDCIAFPARDDIEEDHYAKALVRIGPDGITGDPLGAYVGVMVRVQPTSGSGWPIHGDPASPYAWYKMETAGYSGAMRFMKIMGGNIDYEEDIYYPIEPNTDYELYLEVRGANIIGKINGEVVYEHTDYDLTGGKPGITIYNESSQQQTVIDSFEAGDFATGGSDPPPTPDPDPEPISSGTRAGLVLMASGNGANSRIDNWRAGNFETGTGVTTPVTVSVRVSSTIGTSADTSADDYTYR